MADPGMPASGDSRRFAANAASLMAAQVVGKVASFVFVLIVTRGLGPVEYGWFNFAVSFVPLFLILGTWGLDVAIVRGVVADRARLSELVASGLTIRFASGVVALVLAFAVGPALVSSWSAYGVLVVIGVALLVDEITTLLGTVFNVFERTTVFSTVLLVNRVVSTLLALGAVAAGAGILTVAGTYLAGSLGALAVATFVLRRRFPPIALRDADRTVIRELLHHGMPLGVAGALNMALFRIDAVLIQAIEGATAVGMYGIAYRFFDSFLFIAYGIGQVAMPRIARLARAGSEDRSFGLVLGLLLAFYLPIAVGSLFTAEWVVVTLFGDAYAAAAPAVKWLTWAGVFYALAYLIRVRAVALGRRSQIAVIAGATLVFNIAANLVAIPTWGFAGAAAVTFASEVIESALLVAMLARTSDAVRLPTFAIAPLLACGVMAVAMAATGRGGIAVGVGAVTYAVALPLAALAVAGDDSRRLIGAVRRSGAGA